MELGKKAMGKLMKPVAATLEGRGAACAKAGNPCNIQLNQRIGQGVSMIFNAASRLRPLEDRSPALGSNRYELPGIYNLPKSTILS